MCNNPVQKLRQLRRMMGKALPYRILARDIGVSIYTIYNILEYGREPSPETIRKVQEYLEKVRQTVS